MAIILKAFAALFVACAVAGCEVNAGLSPTKYFKYEEMEGIQVLTKPEEPVSKQVLNDNIHFTLSSRKNVYGAMEMVSIKPHLSILVPGYQYFEGDRGYKGYNGFVIDNIPMRDSSSGIGRGEYKPTPLEDKQADVTFVFHQPGRHYVQWKGDIELCKKVIEKTLRCESEESIYIESNVLEIKISDSKK